MTKYLGIPPRFKLTSAGRIYSSVFLLILLLLVIAVVDWENSSQEADRNARQRIANYLEDSYIVLDEETADLQNLARWLATREDFRNLVQTQDRTGLDGELRPLIKQSVIDYVAVMDPLGQTLSKLSNDPANELNTETLSTNSLAEAAQEQGTSALTRQASGGLEFTYIIPVTNVQNQSLLGYLLVGYSVNEHFIQRVSTATGMQAIVLADNQIAASSFESKDGNPWVGGMVPVELAQRGVNDTSVAFVSLQLNGGGHLFGFKPARITSGGPEVQYGIGIPEKEIDQAAVGSFAGVGLPLAASAFALLITSYLWRRRLSQVNQQLAFATLAIKKGDAAPHPSRAEAAKREEEQKRFWLNVAHELRSPLSSMRTSIDLLLEDYDDLEPSEAETMLQRLQGSAFRFQNLVENLLDYGSIQAGRFTMRPQPVELDVIIHEAFDQVYPLLQARHQRIVLALEREHAMVIADRHRIEEVIVNLVCNASKYSPPNKTITISTCRDSGRVFLGVTDHGEGIPKEEQAAIFQPFYRSHQVAGDAVGLGLGLPLAREIIEQHGGRIGVNSFPGEATTFWFSLPESETENAPVLDKQDCTEYENYASR